MNLRVYLEELKDLVFSEIFISRSDKFVVAIWDLQGVAHLCYE